MFLLKTIRAEWLLVCLGLVAASARGADAEAQATLQLVRQWVHGSYDTQAQADADFAAGLPDDQQHRLMHQLFAPVSVPALAGHVVFQQSSTDGSLDPRWINRVGLLQFFVDERGQVRQRELAFKNPQAFFNAHLEPARLAALTADALTFDAGCDFVLAADADRQLVAGDIPPGSCRLFNEGLRAEMIADDRVEIRPDEYWFRGRYVDAEGRIVWGTASAELNKLVRRAELTDLPPAALSVP